MNYLEKIEKIITEAIAYQDVIDDVEERIVLAQYLRRYRPGIDPDASDTSEGIQSQLKEIIYIEKKTISSIMLRLGYEILEHEISGPIWGMEFAHESDTSGLIANQKQ